VAGPGDGGGDLGVGFFAGDAGLGADGDGEVAGEPDEGCVFGDGFAGFVVTGDAGVVGAGDGVWFGEAAPAPLGVPAEPAGGVTVVDVGSALGAGVSATSSIQAEP
jgi:hypothetical protein